MDLQTEINAIFPTVDEGFVKGDDTPAMTTPFALATAAEYAVVGSTICLIC